MQRSEKSKKMTIYQQLIIGFAAFTVATVAMLWTFQIFLLNPFYKAIKINEVKKIAQEVESVLGKDLMTDAIMEIGRSTGVSIFVCDALGNNQIGYFNPMHSRFGLLTRDGCLAIFNDIRASGGSYLYTGDSREKKLSMSQVQGVPQEILYSTTPHLQDGTDWLILLETEITPVDSTVDTLKVQLMCLTALMLVAGIFVAIFIARKITKPIVSLSGPAKLLSSGRNDVVFEERGSREVIELARTLNYAAYEISQVDMLRRELLANISHDLRTPLTMIKGYGEVMRDLPDENTPENVQVIIDEAERLTNLVNDLMELSKVESGAIPLNVIEFNLTKSILEIIERYDKLADYNFIFIHDTQIWVEADELRISQVVYNLINNAVTYCGDKKTITIKQIELESSVRIEISDYGEGIPADKLKDIWDRYYKVDKEHKRAQIGTGLGLSIVKSILERHHGAYGVTSELGVGSTFWFELQKMKGLKKE